MSDRYICDTSCLVAAVSAWHEHHDRTIADLARRARAGHEIVLASHSIVEAFAVLTRLPSAHRLKPADALSLLGANWGDVPLVHLTGREVWRTLGEAEKRGIGGGRTYDILLAGAARKAGASVLITWNVRHFEELADGFRVMVPE